MRILVAHPGPNFSVADVWAGWVEALRELGQQVFDFNLDDRLAFYDAAYLLVDQQTGTFRKALTSKQAVELALNGLAAALWRVRPHLLLIVSGFFTDPELLDHARRSGTRVVLLCTESPYEDDRQLAIAPHTDLVLLNDPTNLDRFAAVTRAVYIPHAYRPAVHAPGPPDPALACDLGFVGTGYPSRIRFFEALLGRLGGRVTVRLGGNWMRLGAGSPLRTLVVHDLDGCMDNRDAVALYRSAKASINLYRREAAHPELTDGWAMGPREVELAATGCFFLREPRPEGDELLGMLPTVTGPEDAADKLRWWLDPRRDTQRLAAAEAARRAVADRTFTNHAKRLLELLEDKEMAWLDTTGASAASTCR